MQHQHGGTLSANPSSPPPRPPAFPTPRLRHQVGLRIGQFLCGGSLVRSDVVVTAAHCVHPRVPAFSDFDVVLGAPWALGAGCWVRPGCRVLPLGPWTLGLGSWGLCASWVRPGPWILGLLSWVLGPGSWVLGPGRDAVLVRRASARAPTPRVPAPAEPPLTPLSPHPSPPRRVWILLGGRLWRRHRVPAARGRRAQGLQPQHRGERHRPGVCPAWGVGPAHVRGLGVAARGVGAAAVSIAAGGSMPPGGSHGRMPPRQLHPGCTPPNQAAPNRFEPNSNLTPAPARRFSWTSARRCPA